MPLCVRRAPAFIHLSGRFAKMIKRLNKSFLLCYNKFRHGAIAQLVRALRSHRRGLRFEPDSPTMNPLSAGFFVPLNGEVRGIISWLTNVEIRRII